MKLARWFTFVFAATLCSCTDPPAPVPSDDFDGNLIVGDATDLDALVSADAARDAAADGGDGPRDAGGEDGPVAVDLGFADAELPEDGGGRDASELCQAHAETAVSAADAERRDTELDGRMIDVVGTATVGPIACTPATCPASNPCCNACTGPVMIDGIVEIRRSRCFANPGCTGSACLVVCMPVTIGALQRYRGVLRPRTATTGTGLELWGITDP